MKMQTNEHRLKMSTEKIKHFYFTVTVSLSCFFLLLLFYGWYTLRKRRNQSLTQQSIASFRRRTNNEPRSNRGSNTSSNFDKHFQQSLLLNSRI
ncbi:CLUMA_CG010928, isoform A [Clunio marinus]|uniref:CLUMA_CG010928, isoform A n=1 Tax=Clunio marinus TaxID=568069 RepID=A0A1J1IDA3_9DIPT|nr:CLUMA_CG010928, isoform A [Clunio marinus]